MAKELTEFQKMRLYLWAIEHEEIQKKIPHAKGLKQLQLIEQWEELSEKIQKLDPAFKNPRSKGAFVSEVASGVAFGLGAGISQKLMTGKINPNMESFSSALKRNIRDHGFKGAMKQTWKEVKAGKVSPPPKRQKLRTLSIKSVKPKRVSKTVLAHYKRRKRNPTRNPNIIASKDEADYLGATLKQRLSDFPYTNIYVSTLGGPSRPSILITLSLDPKASWPNGILENSRYAKFHLSNNGVLEQITGYKVGKFRKTRVKDVEEVANKLRKFFGSSTVNHPKRNPRNQREFYVVEFPSGQTSQTFSTKSAAEKFNIRFGGTGVVKKMTPYSRSKNPIAVYNPHKKQSRKNPIAIYNPHKQTLLYGRAFIPEIRGIKTNGKNKGERFRHKFDNEVMIYGNPDGSLTVKGTKGVKLWDYEQNI